MSKDFPGVISWPNQFNNLVTLGALTPWDNATTLSSSAVAFLQLWLVEELTGSALTYTMRNLSSGKYLASRDGSSVIIDNPISNASEHWTITPHPLGYYRITNKQFTSMSDPMTCKFLQNNEQSPSEVKSISKFT